MMQVPFGTLPGMSALFLDYIGNWDRVKQFYGHSHSFESILAFSRKRLEEKLPHRDTLCRVLADQQRSWGGNPEVVDKLAKGAVAVVTGQQPGLFTGPLYTILKAINAIKLSRALVDSGIPAVPVFWVAAEDHDYQEVESAFFIDRDSGVHPVRVNLANEEGSPVGWLNFKDDIKNAVGECLDGLPQSEFLPELREMLESSYRPGVSPVDAFARMMVHLFRGTGLIVADPLHPELKAIAEPILKQVVARNATLRDAVIKRNRALSDAGYHEQVKVDQNFTGLFALRGKSRQPLKPGEISGISSDLTLSPNVLVRPMIQDTIFPTCALIAGPAEIAYLAQASAVYETMGRPVTPFFPRISATLLEARVLRSLRKYSIRFEDVFHGKEFLKRKAVESEQSVNVFADLKTKVLDGLESLRTPLNAVDPTLLGALETAKQKMVHQMDTLETKFVNAEARRNEVMEKHLDLIGHSIFPEKKLQERSLNVTSFVARNGIGFLHRLEQAVSLDSTQHQVIEI
jgi:bacillithiol synthase